MENTQLQIRLLKFFRKNVRRPLLLEEVIQRFPYPKDEIPTLKNDLQILIAKGSLVKTRENRIGLPARMNLVTGRLQGHSDGYGFVIPEEEGEIDVFIPSRAMEGAMHGDTVMARIEKSTTRGKREGKVVQILQRAHSELVGRFEKSKNMDMVIPHEKRISHVFYLTPKNSHPARDGDMVIVKILQYPSKKRNPIGRILKIMGRYGDPRIDTDLIIENHDLPKAFPPEILRQVEKLSEEIPPNVIKDRRDLRRLPTVTIDGEQAKDFDDAVSAERLPDGMIRLWVHIADVAHYVPWKASLDQEALMRGTSVYFPDRVIPMFPEKLSNHICSLKPKEDRLTLTCEMVFDNNGTRTDYALYESVIHSKARMTYTEVRDILQEAEDAQPQHPKDIPHLLQTLEDLSHRLNKKRRRRGSIDFDLPEPEIILDLQGKVSDILKQERNIAHRIIEECMLAANETVAEHLTRLEIPVIFRVHEEPDTGKMADLNEFLQAFGLHLKEARKIKPIILQGLLDQVQGTKLEKLINHILLRSMKQARYDTEKKGHFGLAAEHYTHFTSPIRRYPDLIVHRLLKETLPKGSLSLKRKQHLEQILPEIAKHSSEQERRAMEAEREVIDFKKTRFMDDKIGEEWDGFITGVQNFGFFVELEAFFVEGLVHVTSLHDDFYLFVEKQHALIGESTRRTFRIGEKVRVRVDRVNIDQKRIDFSLVESEKPMRGSKTKSKGGGKKRTLGRGRKRRG